MCKFSDRSERMDIRNCPIIPVLRKIPYEESASIIDALYKGGINAVEITMDTTKAESIIRETVERYNDKILVGAGTVLSVEECKRAIEAGAQFLVSPALDLEVLKYATSQQVLFIPGVFTPSEIITANKAGATMVKLFPASSLGPTFIKDVKGPINHIEIMTTGGITKESARSYIEAGAAIIGAGSALVKKEFIQNKNWAGLTEEVESWIKIVTEQQL